MFAAERKRRILDHLRRHGSAPLRDLARLTECSEVTVRRDVRALEAEGLLERSHGGAMVPHGNRLHEPTYSEKTSIAAAEKAVIAAAAVGLVRAGDAIILGAGTTTHALAKRLTSFRELTVVTNSLLVADALAPATGVEVVMTGGTLRGSIHALVGAAAEESLSGLRTASAFISGNGVSADRGLTTPSLVVASVDRALAQVAAEVIVLADHTKVGEESMCQTVPIERISRLITDGGSDAHALAALRAAKVSVEVAASADPGLRRLQGSRQDQF